MTVMPINAIATSMTDVQISPAATLPTWLTSAFWAVFDIMVPTAAALVCCQIAATNNIRVARASISATALLTDLDGNGLMSISEPVRISRSSCQPGKVDNPRNASVMHPTAPILRVLLVSVFGVVLPRAYSRPGNSTLLLNVPASPIKSDGSTSESGKIDRRL